MRDLKDILNKIINTDLDDYAIYNTSKPALVDNTEQSLATIEAIGKIKRLDKTFLQQVVDTFD